MDDIGLLMDNTSALLDAVNSGDVNKVLQIKQEAWMLDINMDISLIFFDVKVPLPKVCVDIMDSRKLVTPEKLLGCLLLQKDAKFVEIVLDIFKPPELSDNDAIICLYHSTFEVYEMITDGYQHTMINKKLLAGYRGAVVNQLKEFIPNFMWCFTPLHVILISCYVSRKHPLVYTRDVIYIKEQCRKLRHVIGLGGVLNGESGWCFPLLIQLLKAGESCLAKAALEDQIIKLPVDTFGYSIRSFWREMNNEAILFLLHDPACQAVDFKGGDFGQELLLSWGFFRKFRYDQLEYLTEFAVHNFFGFRTTNYRATYLDTPSRLYNLHQAGIYIQDPAKSLKYYEDSNIVKRVRQFIEDSKTPFRLEFLAGQVVKYKVGPKWYFEKIMRLHHSLRIPLNVAEYLLRYKYTFEGLLKNEDKWDMAAPACARSRSSLRNHPLGHGLCAVD